MAEQRSPKPSVGGSSPSTPAWAEVAELADALVSKTSEGNLVSVRTRPSAPEQRRVLSSYWPSISGISRSIPG